MENDKELQQNISKLFEEYKLDELHKHYYGQVKNDYERIQNRKKKSKSKSGSKSGTEDKMTKTEYKSYFRHQFSFLLWLGLMAFIGNTLYFSVTAGDLTNNYFKVGLKDIWSGHCMPDNLLPGVPNPTNYIGRIRLLLGTYAPWFNVSKAENFIANPVCEAFRHSLGIIVGAIHADENYLKLLPGLVSKISMPFMLKKLIANVVDKVFKCFENPEYAAQVKQEGLDAEAKIEKEIQIRQAAHEKSMMELVQKVQSFKKSSKKSSNKSSKKSSKKSLRSKTQKSNRRLVQQKDEIKVKVVFSNKDEVQIIPGGPTITKEQFEQNLEDLGLDKVYEDGLKATEGKSDSKKCASKGGSIMAAAATAATVVQATKVVVSGLFAAGTVVYNWDLFTAAKTSFNIMTSGILSQPENARHLMVLNFLGLGPGCVVGQTSLFSTAATLVFTGMSLQSIYAMSQAVSTTAGDTAENFVDYSAKVLNW